MKKITITLLIATVLFGLQTELRAQKMEELWKTAARNNPGLKSAYKELEIALESTHQAGFLPDPSISIGAFILPVETRLGPQRARISLSQMFPWFGTLAAQKSVVAAQAELAHQNFIQEQLKLYLELAKSYYPLYRNREMISLERDNIELLETYRNMVTTRYSNQKGTLADILMLDTEIRNSKARLKIEEVKTRSLLTGLQLNTGLPLDSSFTPIDTLIIVPHEVNREDSLILAHPLLTKIDKMELMQEEKKRMAELQKYPKFGLGIDYMLVGERTDMNPPNNGRDAIMPMATISLPIFQRKYRSQVKTEELVLEKLQSDRQNQILKLEGELELAIVELKTQSELYNTYIQAIEDNESSLRILSIAYSNGQIEFSSLLEIMRRQLDYKKKIVDALAQYHIILAKMQYLTQSETIIEPIETFQK